MSIVQAGRLQSGRKAGESSLIFIYTLCCMVAMCYHCEQILHVCLTVCVFLSVCSCLKILLPCSRRQIAISGVCLAWIGPQP